MKMKFRISDEDLDILEEIIPLQQPYKAGKPWKFAGAFYYATTVLTTIGQLAIFITIEQNIPHQNVKWKTYEPNLS